MTRDTIIPFVNSIYVVCLSIPTHFVLCVHFTKYMDGLSKRNYKTKIRNRDRAIMTVSEAINRQNMAISEAINLQNMAISGAINSQKG